MKQGDNCNLKIIEPPQDFGGTFVANNLIYGQTILPDGSHY